MKVYNAREYNVKPDSFCEKALEEFLFSIPRDEEEKTVVFDKGTYMIDATRLRTEKLYITNTVGDSEFSAEETPHLNRAPLWLSGLKNITVEGNGARFIIYGKSTNAVIDSCENIKIRNITVTADNPEMHELRVLKKGLFYVDYQVDEQSEYICEDGNFYFKGFDYKRSFKAFATTAWWIAHFPADRPHFCKRSHHPLRSAVKIKEKEKGIIRVYDPYASGYREGDRYYLYDVRRQYAGIFVQSSKNVVLENIKQHFNYSLAFVAQNTENITLENLDFTPEKGRVMCSVADFIQICMCRGRVTVRNSKFSGAGDDCMNVHGFHFKITDK